MPMSVLSGYIVGFALASHWESTPRLSTHCNYWYALEKLCGDTLWWETRGYHLLRWETLDLWKQLTHMQVLFSQAVEMQLSQVWCDPPCLLYSEDTGVLGRPWASSPSRCPQFKSKQKQSKRPLWVLEDYTGKDQILLSGTTANIWQIRSFENYVSWEHKVVGMWHSWQVVIARRGETSESDCGQPYFPSIATVLSDTASLSIFQTFLSPALHLPREIRIPLA